MSPPLASPWLKPPAPRVDVNPIVFIRLTTGDPRA